MFDWIRIRIQIRRAAQVESALPPKIHITFYPHRTVRCRRARLHHNRMPTATVSHREYRFHFKCQLIAFHFECRLIETKRTKYGRAQWRWNHLSAGYVQIFGGQIEGGQCKALRHMLVCVTWFTRTRRYRSNVQCGRSNNPARWRQSLAVSAMQHQSEFTVQHK